MILDGRVAGLQLGGTGLGGQVPRSATLSDRARERERERGGEGESLMSDCSWDRS